MTFRRKGRGIIDKTGESIHQPEIASVLAKIVAETIPVVLVLVTVDAKIFPVGAVCGVIPGIAVFVVHR
jgi:hypothetical protein